MRKKLSLLTITFLIGMFFTSINAQTLVDWDPISDLFDANPTFPTTHASELGEDITGLDGYGLLEVNSSGVSTNITSDDAITLWGHSMDRLNMAHSAWTYDRWLTYSATGLTIGDEYTITLTTEGSNGWSFIKINLDAWETSGSPLPIWNTTNFLASSADPTPSVAEPLTLTKTITVTNENMTFGVGTSTNGGIFYLKSWSIVKAGDTESSENDITAFTLAEQTGEATIDTDNHTVEIEVENGTSVTALSPTITISVAASIAPLSGVAQDFTNPVTYTVEAEDETTQDWIVTVVEANPTLKIDFCKALGLEDGYLPYNAIDEDLSSFTDTSYSIFSTSVNFEIRFSSGVTAPAFRGFSDAGIGKAAMANDVVAINKDLNDSIYLVLSDLPVGNYDFTAYSHFPWGGSQGTYNINIDNGTTTVPGSIVCSGNNDTEAGSATITFDADGTNPVVIAISNSAASAAWVCVSGFDLELKTDPISSNNDILTFVLDEQTENADIDEDNHTVEIEVEYGTTISALTPTITISEFATIDSASGVTRDFTNDVTYTVEAEDGTTQNWTVTVTVAPLFSNDNDITAFSLTEQTGEATIDKDEHTVEIEVVKGTAVTDLTPTITVADDASVDPESGVSQDFTNPVEYEVEAEDGTIQIWTVTVTVEPLSDENDITAFTLNEQTGEADIDEDDHTIEIEVVKGTAVTDLTPTITASDDASVDPESGVSQDFTNPVEYEVEAEDGTIQVWTVTVNIEPLSDENDITAFTLNEQTGEADIDEDDHTIEIEVASGTVVNGLTPTIEVSDYASVNPLSDVAQDFSVPVEYEVEAENGIVQVWTVTVTVAPVSTTLVDWNPVSKLFDANPSFPTTHASELWDDIVSLGGFGVLDFDGKTDGVFEVTDALISLWGHSLDYLTVASPQYFDDRWITYSAKGLTVGDEFTMTYKIEGGNAWSIDDAKIKLDAWETGNEPTSVTIHGTNNHDIVAADDALPQTVTKVFIATSENMTFAIGFSSNGGNFHMNGWTIEKTASAELSDETDITGFSFTEQTGAAAINTTNHTVEIEVESGTDVTALVPTITLSDDADISPLSGVARNFTNPVTYTIEAEDGTTQIWTVTVLVEEESSLEQNELSLISIYPNPTAKVVHIDLSSINGIVSVSLFNIAGIKVLERNNISGRIFTLTNLDSGLYIVNIESNGVKTSRKLFVK